MNEEIKKKERKICPECVDGIRTIFEPSRTYDECCLYCGGSGLIEITDTEITDTE